MKNIIVVLLLTFVSFAHSQEDAWVYFTDKPDADFYLSNPLEMLTQRALDRRQLQGLSLDVHDVPVYTPYIDEVLATGITVMAKSKWFNALHVRGSIDDIQGLAALPFVSGIHFANRFLNASGRVKPVQTPPLQRQASTQISFPYGASSNQITMLNGHLLHEENFTGQGKIIAVLDSGFPNVDVLAVFQRIRSNNQILGGYNFVGADDNYFSLNGHGTMVLSTMAGFAENQLVGTAPDASYLLYITEDVAAENPVEESYWVAAAEEADRLGADVINTSLGYFIYDNPDYNYTFDDLNGDTSFISRGANMAFSRGMVVVVSAGNSGASSNPFIGMPADAHGALTVGAVDGNGNYVSFSSRGPTADMRIKPDVMAKGAAATVCTVNGNIATANGTSFSGPIIAGMVASFWSALPTLTAPQVVQYIRESAHLFANPTDFMGYGIPDFQTALGTALQLNTSDINWAQLSPNPVANTFLVNLPDDLVAANMIIYNNLGQIALKTQVNAASLIDVAHFPSGLYFYVLSANGKQVTGRLIKK